MEMHAPFQFDTVSFVDRDERFTKVEDCSNSLGDVPER
jgi:hypothetical protein